MEKLRKFNCRTIVMANTARKAKGGRRSWKINNCRRVLLSFLAKHCHINRLATVTRCLRLCEKCLFTKARCNKLSTVGAIRTLSRVAGNCDVLCEQQPLKILKTICFDAEEA